MTAKTETCEPREPTLEEIGRQAKAKADRLLDDARESLRGTDKALKEASSTPLFGNGLASAMKEALRDAEGLDEKIQALRARLDAHFRPDAPPEEDRTATMRGET